MKDFNWTIRLATEEDIENMLLLWEDVSEFMSSVPDTPESVKKFMQYNLKGCLVAVSGTELVGSVMAAYDGWRGCIYHLAVKPEYQGHGIGKALMEQAMQEFKRLGAVRVYLYTKAGNKNAREFYRHLRWVERDDIIVFNWDITGDSNC
ncbi:GNAT family N-acetyltransferase [Syntrophomonas palmitatica]|uniref:GNAT family N-acetyltransferase n=1 Tax=Syntrophomonas palmitatica TaxID=402877 RepID=UPI0006D29FBA|nr:GNAT family N-acetyltransferase [Syntrophomonas palmitatica]